jgi:hypothetical protein
MNVQKEVIFFINFMFSLIFLLQKNLVHYTPDILICITKLILVIHISIWICWKVENCSAIVGFIVCVECC